jgi:hypothetical protein
LRPLPGLPSLRISAGVAGRFFPSWFGLDLASWAEFYAHALREEEHDLSFLDFGGAGRQQTAPREPTASEAEGVSDEIPNDLA